MQPESGEHDQVERLLSLHDRTRETAALSSGAWMASFR